MRRRRRYVATTYIHFHDKLALFSAVLDELLPAFPRVLEPPR